MPWNWELPEWPRFTYQKDKIAAKEREFLIGTGKTSAVINNISEEDGKQFIIEIMSLEGIESAKIEGEVLDRSSLQSSIRKHFGLKDENKRESKKEAGMAALLYSVYKTYDKPLTHQMLHDWHKQLFKGQTQIEVGHYRTHEDPMQIVSNRNQKIHFEAPPSSRVQKEMTQFIKWFNSDTTKPLLEKAAIAHVYFESIHPYEDGNGRIGRLLIEKILSHGIGRPTLIAISRVLESNKKNYYEALSKCNRTLQATPWVVFMSDAILQAQEESMEWLQFLMNKSKIMNLFKDKLNHRQEKVLLRIYKEGISGFKGGLSAENYISITKTSRATATRDLAELVEIGVLRKTGELRHTRYFIA